MISNKPCGPKRTRYGPKLIENKWKALYWLYLFWAHFWTEMEQKCSSMNQTWSQMDHTCQMDHIGPNRPDKGPNQLEAYQASFDGPMLFWVPNILMKSGYLSKSWISIFFMTNSSGVIKEGSGITFEVYHAHLTQYWLPSALLSPKITNEI